MSKAMLVMDMPSSCSECPCCYVSRCEVNEKALKTSEIYECKPDWCPLRELPQKQVNNCLDNTYQRGAKNGWNFCIDEILKGSEENG